ncbi:unnamed protein product [Owenia fusiformis]|uniref:Chitin-binding type-2 domain-containing protein n=1 Tax=Owenia fusiformis TaxID=6347 RepID=A0A8S4N0Z9_OWEFU|nr:unnamed protein product [Owenia fusiformis]
MQTVLEVFVGCIAMAMASDYATKAYEPKYPTHGYQRNNGYHQDSYVAPSYNSHDSYKAPSYNSYEAPSYNTYETKSYTHCNSYGYGSYMYNTCKKCATTYSSYFTCPKTYYPAETYVAQPSYGHESYNRHNSYNSYQAPAQKFHFKHSDDSCFWQCDASGKALARPCPYGLVFDEYKGVCVNKSY